MMMGNEGGMMVNIRVKTMDSKEHRLQMRQDASITDMKQKIEEVR